MVLGAQYFYIYNHSTNDTGVKSVLDYYVNMGVAEVIPWNLPARLHENTSIWYYAQLTMLNDCMLRNRGISRFVVSTDLDEFIIPRVGDRLWDDLINSSPLACEYTIKSCVFLSLNATNATENRNLIQNSDVIHPRFNFPALRKVFRRDHIFKHRVRSKYIARPECIDMVGVHYNFLFANKADSSMLKQLYVHENSSLVHHFMSQKRKDAQIGRIVFDDSIKYLAERMDARVKKLIEKL